MLIYIRAGYIITEINISFGGFMLISFLKSTDHEADPMMCLLFFVRKWEGFFSQVPLFHLFVSFLQEVSDL